MRYKSPEMMEKIIRFVDEYYMVHQKSPSMAMIADEVGLHRSNVQRYLVEMTENGMLKQEGRKIVTPAIEKNSKPVLAAHVGSIRCGTPEFEEQDIDAYFTLPEAIIGKGEYYILTAKGDSMIAMIKTASGPPAPPSALAAQPTAASENSTSGSVCSALPMATAMAGPLMAMA